MFQLDQNSRTVIRGIRALEWIFLFNNELVSLPETFGGVNRLTHAYLHNNKLSSLPKTIRNMKAIIIFRDSTSYPIRLVKRSKSQS